jgi:hypothetical protein
VDRPTVKPSAVKLDPATMVFKSDPKGAEIIVDGKFLGTTPSTVQLSPSAHLVSLGKAGYQLWQRELTTTPGGIGQSASNSKRERTGVSPKPKTQKGLFSV